MLAITRQQAHGSEHTAKIPCQQSGTRVPLYINVTLYCMQLAAAAVVLLWQHISNTSRIYVLMKLVRRLNQITFGFKFMLEHLCR